MDKGKNSRRSLMSRRIRRRKKRAGRNRRRIKDRDNEEEKADGFNGTKG
jgi:hypothetical protein